METMGVAGVVSASSALLALGEIESLPELGLFSEVEEDACPTAAIAAHCRSPLAFVRLAYSQGIATAAAHVEYGLVADVLLPLVEGLLEDRERVIRLAVLQQLPALGMCLRKKDEERSHKDIHDTLMGIAVRAMLEDDDEISQAAILVYRCLAALLTPQHAAAATLNVVQRLQARSSDEATVAAVRLFAHAAESMPADVLEREAPVLLERWADHRDFSVREATAVCLSLIAARMSPAAWHDCIVPCVQLLHSDPNWRVRKACSLDLPRLARLLQQQEGGVASSEDSSRSSRDSSISTDGDHEARIDSGSRASSSDRGLRIPTSSLARRVLAHHRQRGSVEASPSFEHPVLRLSQPQKEKLLEAAGSVEESLLAPPTPCQTPPPALPLDPRKRLLAHQTALRDCMEALTSDGSHWVKVSALSSLGAFLVALPAPLASPRLLGRFTAMAASSVVIHDVSVSLACAQSIGDVTERLGAERWHELRDAFATLRSSRDPAVLQALVAALPHLASVLGPAATQQELLPALMALLHAQLPAIQPALVPRLGQLLRVLPTTAHALLVRVVPALAAAHPERCGQWRLRRDLAMQLGSMAHAAAREHLEDTLWPAALLLCGDPVAAVRLSAAVEVGKLLALLERDGAASGAAQIDGVPDGRARRRAGSDSSGSTDGGSSTSSSSSDDEQGHSSDVGQGAAGCMHRLRLGKSGAPIWQRRTSSGDADDETYGGYRAASSTDASDSSGAEHSAFPAPLSLATNGTELGGASHDAGPDGAGRPPLLMLPPVAVESAFEASLPCALTALADVGAKIVDVGAGADVLQRPASSPTAADAPTAQPTSAAGSGGMDASSRREAAAGAVAPNGTLAGASARPPRSPGNLAFQLGNHHHHHNHNHQKLQRSASDDLPKGPPSRPASPALHPAMVPVGQVAALQQQQQQQEEQQQQLQKRSASTGDLTAMANQQTGHKIKRRSSTSRLATSSGGAQEGWQLPLGRQSGNYIEALVSRFGQSSLHQDRRLFVALAAGVAAHAWGGLQNGQRASVKEQLQQLSRDAVPSVRASVEHLTQSLQQQPHERGCGSANGHSTSHVNDQDAPLTECFGLLKGSDAGQDLLAALISTHDSAPAVDT